MGALILGFQSKSWRLGLSPSRQSPAWPWQGQGATRHLHQEAVKTKEPSSQRNTRQRCQTPKQQIKPKPRILSPPVKLISESLFLTYIAAGLNTSPELFHTHQRPKFYSGEGQYPGEVTPKFPKLGTCREENPFTGEYQGSRTLSSPPGPQSTKKQW